MARKFFYVCAGMLMLALSYHLGANTATAQAPGNPVVATFIEGNAVVTASGDVYQSSNGVIGPWTLMSNTFSGGPTPARQQTWGQLKSRYAPNRGAARAGSEPR